MADTIPFTFRHYIGETPAFDTAHIAIEVRLPPRERWPDLIAASVAASEDVARIVADADLLSTAASFVRSATHANPFAIWLRAFAQMSGIVGWRHEIEIGANGTFRIRVACPYVAEVRRWAAITQQLLTLAMAKGRADAVTIDREEWQHWIASIGTGLPAPDQILLHAVAAADGVAWGWGGDARTVVGWGSRQKILNGGGRDAQTVSRALASMDLRIPIYTINGSLGKTTTTRLLTQMLETAGLRLGLTTSDGAFANGEQLGEGDCIDGRNALAVLQRRDVDLAVLEVGRGGIISQGIPYAETDVAILLNVLPMHLDQYGIGTVEAIADVKALSLKRARIAVLNHDDGQCRRLAGARDPGSCVWFSATMARMDLRRLSRGALGAIGINRAPDNTLAELEIWQSGKSVMRLSLAGVTPYHGMLGEKTAEELAAAVAAAWFGPVRLREWGSMLKRLRLDNVNHRFRTSSHRRGNILFVLDKAGDLPPLELLSTAVEDLCRAHDVHRRIAVFTRSARHGPEKHRLCCASLHRFMDEFICFDRPDTYSAGGALPVYTPGSIVRLLADELRRLNVETGVEKPISTAADWNDVEIQLRSLLDEGGPSTLVLINQPATGAKELNRRILQFVDDSPSREDPSIKQRPLSPP